MSIKSVDGFLIGRQGRNRSRQHFCCGDPFSTSGNGFPIDGWKRSTDSSSNSSSTPISTNQGTIWLMSATSVSLELVVMSQLNACSPFAKSYNRVIARGKAINIATIEEYSGV
jgi:hypothetical protein